MNRSLFKSLSSKTNSVGDGKVNRSVTVTMVVACLFDKMAALWRMSVNGMLRVFIVAGAESTRHPLSRELRHALRVPSIHDPLPIAQKVTLIARDIKTLRSPSETLADEYVREFAELKG